MINETDQREIWHCAKIGIDMALSHFLRLNDAFDRCIPRFADNPCALGVKLWYPMESLY